MDEFLLLAGEDVEAYADDDAITPGVQPGS